MTEPKTQLPIPRRPDADNVPRPRRPGEVPASKAVAKYDRAEALPVPRKPVEVPATPERPITKTTPRLPPPVQAPRNLPAVREERNTELQPEEYQPAAKAPYREEEYARGPAMPVQNAAPVIQEFHQTIVVQAPAPVVYVPLHHCPRSRWNCPLLAGFPCRRFFCSGLWW